MSKHEIRLRRQKLTARGSDRFRNYGAVLERHEQEKKLKRIVKAFTFFLLIAILVLLLVIVVRIERRSDKKSAHVGTCSRAHVFMCSRGSTVYLKSTMNTGAREHMRS
jgi:hypothetical protein